MGSRAVSAQQCFGPEVTKAKVLDDTVGNAIKTIALI